MAMLLPSKLGQACGHKAASRRSLSPCCSLRSLDPCQAPQNHRHSRRYHLQQLAAGVAGVQLWGLLQVLPANADMAHDAARGVVDFWKSRQRQNGGIKLLAPLRVAQRRLEEARQLLDMTAASKPEDVVAVDEVAVTDILQRVRASSLNCYTFEAFPDDTVETKASLLTAKLELSDPCTFRIVLKNITNLEPPAVKEEAVRKMDNLVMSYQRLDSALEMARDGHPDAIPKAQQEIQTTMQVASDIESFVKSVLGV